MRTKAAVLWGLHQKREVEEVDFTEPLLGVPRGDHRIVARTEEGLGQRAPRSGGASGDQPGGHRTVSFALSWIADERRHRQLSSIWALITHW